MSSNKNFSETLEKNCLRIQLQKTKFCKHVSVFQSTQNNGQMLFKTLRKMPKFTQFPGVKIVWKDRVSE